MITVTFVCLGNICRSPMAEAVFARMVAEQNLSGSITVRSFGTSDEEEGNPVYPPVARLLKEKGYTFTHRAKQISYRDVVNSNYVLVMDTKNLFDLLRVSGSEQGKKIYKLGSFMPETIDIADPWYTRDFSRTYDEIKQSCANLLQWICQKHAQTFAYDKKRQA